MQSRAGLAGRRSEITCVLYRHIGEIGKAKRVDLDIASAHAV